MAGRSTRDREAWLAKRGGSASLLRPLEALYRCAVGARGALYDRGWLPVERLDTPVICVGNLSVGGTGKTPMTAWVCRELLKRERRPGLLSRGYRGDGEENDEARLLRRLLPSVPHVQNADRATGGRELEERGVDVIVMDDGFQHRRLFRDLDWVLVDATRPWGLPAGAGEDLGLAALLPRGYLRETLGGLARAHAVILTRTDQAAPERVERLEDEVLRHAPGSAVVHARHAPSRVIRPDGTEAPVEELRGERVILASGIGNPDAFEQAVRDLGAEVVEHRRFPDHHPWRPEDLSGCDGGEPRLVTTAKDAVKLEPLGIRPWTLEVEMAFTRGEAVLAALLDALPTGAEERMRHSFHEGLHG